MEKIDKFALKQAIEDTDRVANHLTVLYPYLYITSDGDRFGDKSEIKEDIKDLKYLSYMLSRELLKIIDNDAEEKSGTWIYYEEHDPNPWECDKCHNWSRTDSEYCPHCGVKMERRIL